MAIRSVLKRFCMGLLRQVASKSGDDPVPVLSGAVDNVKPSVEVRSRRVGGATYQVPVEVRPDRRLALSLRWFLNGSRSLRAYDAIPFVW